MSAHLAYHERILPLVRQLMDLCREHEIPAMAVFELRQGQEGELKGTSNAIDAAHPKLQAAAEIVKRPDARTVN